MSSYTVRVNKLSETRIYHTHSNVIICKHTWSIAIQNWYFHWLMVKWWRCQLIWCNVWFAHGNCWMIFTGNSDFWLLLTSFARMPLTHKIWTDKMRLMLGLNVRVPGYKNKCWVFDINKPYANHNYFCLSVIPWQASKSKYHVWSVLMSNTHVFLSQCDLLLFAPSYCVAYTILIVEREMNSARMSKLCLNCCLCTDISWVTARVAEERNMIYGHNHMLIQKTS